MATDIVVRPSVDSAFLAWHAPYIKDCRGFALTRRIKRAAGSAPSPETVKQKDGFAIELVSSWVGFADGPKVADGTRKPTNEWPIQKYVWSDFMVNPGDQVAYRVTPMIGSEDALEEDNDNASDWTPTVNIGEDTPGNITCYFNRGIVASQWLSRLLPDTHSDQALRTIIAQPGNKIRNFLGGPVREKLVSLLTTVNQSSGHIFAALFELDDPELIPLLQAFGKRAHILLGNGSVKKKGEDENADARDAIRMCDVHDRMTAPRALAHNKFLVICDAHATPQAVWTGSTNWTKTGLCTQANNALLVQNPALAQDYLDHWKTLVDCEDASPASLLTDDATARTVPGLDGTTLWFTPMHGLLDLDQAGEMIRGARDGILFLMFNPGPRGTLFNDIVDLASPSGQNYDPDLYIQGVLNQNPGTAKNPVTLFNRGERIDANADVVLPAKIPGPFAYWHEELLKLPGTFAMVHSKVIVIDPYGEKPIVMTGSHNMGPKASGTNDENLLLIEGNGALASQYAGNIMQIYSQYRWRQSVQTQGGKPAWDGLADNDAWQIGAPTANQDDDRRRLRELQFWFGAPVGGVSDAGHVAEADDHPSRREARPVERHSRSHGVRTARQGRA